MEKRKIAVIGAGVSGLSVAQLLKNNHEVVVFEKEARAGGLIRCEEIDGNLYHLVGGHVFNSKLLDVLEWFWQRFDQEREFRRAQRNAVVAFDDNLFVKYPIENHVYQLPKPLVEAFIKDMLGLKKSTEKRAENFQDFLLNNFGETLYRIYFQPYNEKVWRRDLSEVSLEWLEGKLPMPNVEEMLFNNFCHVEEQKMVHSSFFYPQKNGSQFLADRLAQGLTIKYNQTVERIEKVEHRWAINGDVFDLVVFCGNIKHLPQMLDNQISDSEKQSVERLESHGTTSVFCEIDANPYSWIYMPSDKHASHRIICTGNFATANNNVPEGRITASIEFTDYVSKADILQHLQQIPLHPRYIAHHYTQYTYPIQDGTTRADISAIKHRLEAENFYLLGRFAEWEYYNMDTAIKAAMCLAQRIDK